MNNRTSWDDNWGLLQIAPEKKTLANKQCN